MYFDKEIDANKYPSIYQYTKSVKQPVRDIVGRNAEINQILAAMMRPELCNVILLAPAGSGKAHANGTLVPVNDERGYVPIEDLKKGDFVFDEHGKPIQVLNVFPQGNKSAYEVGFSDGSVNVCNDEHIWNVRTKSAHLTNADNYENKTLRELISLGIRNQESVEWYIPRNKAIQRDAIVLPKDPYVVGMLLNNQSIPRSYMYGSIEQRKRLLQGLMDSDGHVIDNEELHCSFHTDFKDLALDVRELSASLGYRTCMTDIINSEHQQEYVVSFCVTAQEMLELFTLSCQLDKIRKSQHFKNSDCLNDIGIEYVVSLGYELPMTCIYVDSPTHLYQVGKEHLVTHNTALVQGTMQNDNSRYYFEVDLSKMLSDIVDKNQMADRLKRLFDEVEQFCKNENIEVVLFMDEFHQVVQLSPAAVEALKPMLADSGTRGIRVIAATTFDEFQQYIAPNQPLVERLQRMDLKPPNQAMVVDILRNVAERYNVSNQFYNDNLFKLIYDYTERYIPSSAQPRKSIRIFDNMIGWYRYNHRRLNRKLLADVIFESEGINVSLRVDAKKIQDELDKHVFAQKYATRVIAERLQICVADLNDKSKPQSSFLFTGSSGVGKTEIAKQMAQILFQDKSRLLRMDMTEFANDDSLDRFRHELTAMAWAHPYSIILLDEIEKASGVVTRLLLQVLDDGRLMDENGKEIPFNNAYIILTTNAGSEIYQTIAQYDADDEGSGVAMAKYKDLIYKSLQDTGSKFPPELLGRIDVVVPFQPLSEATQMHIVANKLADLSDLVFQKHDVILEFKRDVVEYIVKDNLKTDSNAGGARAAISKLEMEVTAEVARCLNENPNAGRLLVDVSGAQAWQDKSMLKSQARIRVNIIQKKSY